MFKISDVISKPVYTIYEGVLVGTIINFVYDNNWKKIKGFFIFDDESESEHYIESKNIYKIGTENVLIRNRSKIQISKFEKKTILNMKITSVDGSWAGEIREVFFDKRFKVKALGTRENLILPPDIIVSIGQDIILFDNNEKRINVSRMKPVTKILVENLPNIKVNILENSQLEKTSILGDISDEKGKSSNVKVAKKKLILPPNILSNPKSIIGKKVKDNLMGLNGEIIIKKGETITEKIYYKAKRHSKLFELTNNV